MSTVVINYDVELDVIECYKCGVMFGITSDLNKTLHRNHDQSFYCPNGHGQVYTGKTEAEKLRDQLSEEKKKLANTQFELMAAKQRTEEAERAKAKLQKSIKNGACPCCHRQFTQLTRHMKTKHPEYVSK